MSEQLVFDLPHRSAQGADDFLVSACNEVAVEVIDAWPGWAHPVYLIEGPSGCGKSHLANVWRQKTGAEVWEPASLAASRISGLSPGSAVILEGLDCNGFDEQSLFHLLNLAKQRGIYLLLTARVPPARWDIQLPDLISRLRAVPVAVIGAPDDVLLSAVLLKHFSDRQLNVEPQVIKFLARRMIRSMEAANQLVAAIDREALATGKKITRQFTGEVLERYQSE